MRSPALYLSIGTVLTVNVLKNCDTWRAFDGDCWTIQAKYRSNPSSALTFDELSTFAGLSSPWPLRGLRLGLHHHATRHFGA